MSSIPDPDFSKPFVSPAARYESDHDSSDDEGVLYEKQLKKQEKRRVENQKSFSQGLQEYFDECKVEQQEEEKKSAAKKRVVGPEEIEHAKKEVLQHLGEDWVLDFLWDAEMTTPDSLAPIPGICPCFVKGPWVLELEQYWDEGQPIAHRFQTSVALALYLAHWQKVENRSELDDDEVPVPKLTYNGIEIALDRIAKPWTVAKLEHATEQANPTSEHKKKAAISRLYQVSETGAVELKPKIERYLREDIASSQDLINYQIRMKDRDEIVDPSVL